MLAFGAEGSLVKKLLELELLEAKLRVPELFENDAAAGAPLVTELRLDEFAESPKLFTIGGVNVFCDPAKLSGTGERAGGRENWLG